MWEFGHGKGPLPTLESGLFFARTTTLLVYQPSAQDVYLGLKTSLCSCGIRGTSPAPPERQMGLRVAGPWRCQSPEVAGQQG